MRTIFHVEYLTPGPRNQVLERFTSKGAAEEFMEEFPPDFRAANLRVVPTPVYDTPEEARKAGRRR